MSDMLIGIIPMVFIIIGGTLITRFGPEEHKNRRLIYLLIVFNTIFLALLWVSTRVRFQRTLLGHDLDPWIFGSIAGIVTLLVLNYRDFKVSRTEEKIPLIFLIVMQVFLFTISSYQGTGLIFYLFITVLLILIAWWIRNRPLLTLVIIFVLLITLSNITWFSYLQNARNNLLPENIMIARLFSIPFLLILLIPGLGIAIASVLLMKIMDPTHGNRSIREERTTKLGLKNLSLFITGILLIAGTAYALYWHTIWDSTSDGLASIFILLPSILVAIGSGIVIAIKGNVPAKITGILLGFLIPILLINVQESGWQVSYHEITENRAARIENALEKYFEREGNYPAQLSELTPRDMLFVRPPVILMGEEWCYQGQMDSYRLGAVYREYFSTPFSIREYVSAGDPDDVWDCEERLPEIQEQYEAP